MDVFLNGSAKKPLRVIIVLVIIAMCLLMADGSPTHRKRHARGCQHRLETAAEQRNRNKTARSGAQEIPLKPGPFGNRLHVIQARLTYTLSKFTYIQSNLNETRLRAKGKAEWLPKVNFVDIVKKNHGGAVKRFELLVPKLYKNMRHFQALFHCLQNVHDDNLDSSNPEDRRLAIDNHEYLLSQLVVEVSDRMKEFNRCVPAVDATCNKEEMQKLGFHFDVDQSLRMEQDALAYRAYTKSLKNWKRAFRCGLPSFKDNVFCRKWRQQFQQRRRVKTIRH